jgi:hypothetical protein
MRQNLPIQLNMLQINLKVHLSVSKKKSKWNTTNILNERIHVKFFCKTNTLAFLSLKIILTQSGMQTAKWPVMSAVWLGPHHVCREPERDLSGLTQNQTAACSSPWHQFNITVIPRFFLGGGAVRGKNLLNPPYPPKSQKKMTWKLPSHYSQKT